MGILDFLALLQLTWHQHGQHQQRQLQQQQGFLSIQGDSSEAIMIVSAWWRLEMLSRLESSMTFLGMKLEASLMKYLFSVSASMHFKDRSFDEASINSTSWATTILLTSRNVLS